MGAMAEWPFCSALSGGGSAVNNAGICRSLDARGLGGTRPAGNSRPDALVPVDDGCLQRSFAEKFCREDSSALNQSPEQ